MRWARRQLENSPGLLWPAGGPRHLIVDSSTGTLISACKRAVLPPFELVPEMPADLRCQRCDRHAQTAAVDAEMTDPPKARANC